mmetsp:Transcript_30433/g.70521  ORF Transcript_30433/g.70521 Transcript_30433/m.70521 type:complete len:287 (-) Transcript_30433:414-1274(-)
MMWPLSRTTTPTTIDDTESMHTEIENLRKELELKSETLSLYQADMVKYVALFEEKEKVDLHNQQLRLRIQNLENNEVFAQMSEELQDAKHECLALHMEHNSYHERVDILERREKCAKYFLRREVTLRCRMQGCFTTWKVMARTARDALEQDQRPADPHTGPPDTSTRRERLAVGLSANRHAAGAISITRWRHNHTLKSVSISVAWHKWRSHYHQHWGHVEARLRGKGASAPQLPVYPESIGYGEGEAWTELEEAVTSLASSLPQRAKGGMSTSVGSPLTRMRPRIF